MSMTPCLLISHFFGLPRNKPDPVRSLAAKTRRSGPVRANVVLLSGVELISGQIRQVEANLARLVGLGSD